jgi:hypothetical protein
VVEEIEFTGYEEDEHDGDRETYDTHLWEESNRVYDVIQLELKICQ